ncbi:PKD domain-containing protein [Paracrocinitomix mangrovi]|uniref:PKD domain-containing protein n=1 Tax=Paracrocinitomix mangrovi TaxID=2862509 RepID=UPI001C8E2AC6|nr:PKD domain-containing protein [Paracrocinitomix mangrovi]UKN01267.1 PKD domain-containing protein [Paracrocinitomix mangrovi]
MPKKILLAFLLLVSLGTTAQNLVLNPSFETVNTGALQCSWYTSQAQFNNAISNWTCPTGGSTDIFNTALATTCYCSPFSTNAANPGQQAPHSGNGYVNIVTYGNGGCTPWREYVQGTLSTPLVAGNTYEVSFWVSLADKMSVGTNNIGVKFEVGAYNQGSNCPYYTTPELNYTGPIILDKANWTQITFCYTPTVSGQDHFIIGNFFNDGATATAAAGGVTTGNTIRYYVDDVVIQELVLTGGDPGTNGTASVCPSDPAFNLFDMLGGTPDAGGTWTGPSALTGGSLGTFTPGVNTPGVYTYSVTGTGACVAGTPATATVTVSAGSADATITPAGPFCDNAAAVTLTAVDPGGTWSGTGITNATTGTFDPAVAGPGTHTITYTISGACSDVDTETITVNASADATITAVGPFCQTDAAITLSAVDGGGTWSGTGITNATTGTFDPAVAGPGTHTITYTIGGTCGDVQTTSIVINALANATITAVGPFCDTDPAITLNAVDAGGTWSGTGITNTTTGAFDPAVAGAGTHTITYTIAGSCGDVQTTDIVVNNVADATITAVGPFCDVDAAVTLSAVDAGGTWTGTGITNGATGIFDPAVAGAGTHTITYTIAGACGDVQTTDIVVNPQMDATIAAVGPFCDNDAALVLAGADPGGTWSGTGITNAANGDFDPAVAGAGTHTITYTIVAACGDVQTTDIVVNALADATITAAGPFCENELAVNLSAVDVGGTWSGTGITDAALGTFDPATAGVGTHTITYTIAGACGATDTEDIIVNQLDDPTINPAGPFCLNNNVEVITAVTAGGTWSGTGITDATLGEFMPMTAGEGTHTVTYTTGGICPNTGTVDVVVLGPLSVTALQNATICEGESADLSATGNGGDGNITITWTDDQGNNLGTNANITVSPMVTTTYTATVTDGCNTVPVSDQVTVTVNPMPVINFTPDKFAGCVPLTVNFTNNSVPAGTNCTWDFGDGDMVNDCGVVSNIYNSAGCYDVTLTVTENNCTSTATMVDLICVYDYAEAEFALDPGEVDVENTLVEFDNSSVNATEYLWTFGDGDSSTVENPVHVFPAEIGVYQVCLKAMNAGGCNDSTCQSVIVTEELLFYVPNVFTPDGDNFNETFLPVFTQGFDIYDFHFTIFNRWGEIIWESYNSTVGWNGHYGQGGLVEDGVYVWQVEFKSNQSDEKIKKRGHVSVLK